MRNKILSQFFAFLAIALVFSGCANDNNDAVKKDQGVEIYSLTEIKGEHVDNGHLVQYHVKEVGNAYHLTVNVEGNTLEADVSYNPFSASYNGHDAQLNEAQLSALQETANGLMLYMLEKKGLTGDFIDISEADNTLVRILEHWATAPANYPIGKINSTINIEKGLNDDGITCIKKGRYYYVSYDNSSGQAFTEYQKAGYSTLPNGSSCMGLCGGNCGYWWWPKTWCLDCFEHDECYVTLNNGGGPLFDNANCGDEWIHAIDDFIFGYLSGCKG